MKFLLPIAALAVLLAGCSKPENDQTLTVGMDLSYPPFETIDQAGEPAGISPDLARDLGRHLGRKVKIENIPFVGLIPSLQTGRIDCIISSMTDTPARRETVDFSEPYLAIGLSLLTRKGSGIHSFKDLDENDHTLAVRQGTTGQLWANLSIKRAKILVLDKESSAVLEVIQGKADAFIYDQMSVWTNWRQHPDETEAVLEPIQKESWAIALRKDETALKAEINAFLKGYRARGGFEELGNKYLLEQKNAFKEKGVPFYF